MRRRKPSACELVAAALNEKGVPSDHGGPWTENDVVEIYGRMSSLTNILMQDREFATVMQPAIDQLWPAVENQAAKRGLRAKPTH